MSWYYKGPGQTLQLTFTTVQFTWSDSYNLPLQLYNLPGQTLQLTFTTVQFTWSDFTTYLYNCTIYLVRLFTTYLYNCTIYLVRLYNLPLQLYNLPGQTLQLTFTIVQFVPGQTLQLTFTTLQLTFPYPLNIHVESVCYRKSFWHC